MATASLLNESVVITDESEDFDTEEPIDGELVPESAAETFENPTEEIIPNRSTDDTDTLEENMTENSAARRFAKEDEDEIIIFDNDVLKPSDFNEETEDKSFEEAASHGYSSGDSDIMVIENKEMRENCTSISKGNSLDEFTTFDEMELTSADMFLDKFFTATRNPSTSAFFGQEESLTFCLRGFLEWEEKKNARLSTQLASENFAMPTQLFVPPSQVVEMMSIWPPEMSVKSWLDASVAESSNRFSWAPCPKMTEIVADLGYNLVVESAYESILERYDSEKRTKERQAARKDKKRSRNDSDSNELTDDSDVSVKRTKVDATTKIEAEKKDAQMNRLRNSRETMGKTNEPFRAPLNKKCLRCSFRTDSVLIMTWHMSHPEYVTRSSHTAVWECHICGKDFDDDTEIRSHYTRQHDSPCFLEKGNLKYECPTCDSSFQLKGSQVRHFLMCKREFSPRRLLAPVEADLLHINRLFWSLSQKQLRDVQASMTARSTRNVAAPSVVKPKTLLSTFQMGRRPRGRPPVLSGPRFGGSTKTIRPLVTHMLPLLRPAVPKIQLPPLAPKQTLSAGVGATLVSFRPQLMLGSNNSGRIVGALIPANSPAFNVIPSTANRQFPQKLSTTISSAKPVVRKFGGSSSYPGQFIGKSNLNRLKTTAGRGNPLPGVGKPEVSIQAATPSSTSSARNNAQKVLSRLSVWKRAQRGKFKGPVAPVRALTNGNASLLSPKPKSIGLRLNVDPPGKLACEVCDFVCPSHIAYLSHLRKLHNRCFDKTVENLRRPGPLTCSRCSSRFHCYDGLERHLLMNHNLVTSDLLQKAQKKADSGRCQLCGKVFAFNLLFHISNTHKRELCSADVMYNCDMCDKGFRQYSALETHLQRVHSQGGVASEVKPQPTGVPADNQAQGPIAAFLSNFLNGVTPTAKPSLPAPLKSNAPKGSTLPTAKSTSFGKKPNILQSVMSRPKLPSIKSPGASTKATGSDSELVVYQPVKKMRYNCTPCGLKFNDYADVLKHWELRHLKQLRVEVCRIDRCSKCRSDAEKVCRLPSELEDLAAEEEATSHVPLDVATTSATSVEEIILDDD